VAPAFGQTELRWRLAPEEHLELALSQRSSTAAEIAGRTYKSSLQIAATLQWHVIAVDEQGAATIEQTLSHLRATIEVPGAAAVQYDSSSQEKLAGAAKAVADEFRPIVGKPARLKLLATGQIEDAPEARRPERPLSTRDIRQLLGRLLPALPAARVSPGDVWSDRGEQITPEGKVVIESKYVARGPEEHGGRPAEKIEAAYEYSAATGKDVTLEFSAQHHRGEFHFDAAAGRLLHGEINQAMTVKILLDEAEVAQQTQSRMTLEVRALAPAAVAK
jgi:hypothetical protein